MVWHDENVEPPVTVFCELVKEWPLSGKLWIGL